MLYPVPLPAVVQALPPQPSPFSAATSAALLGAPMSVGHPILPAATQSLQNETKVKSEPEGKKPREDIKNLALLPVWNSGTGNKSAGVKILLAQAGENVTPPKTTPLGAIELKADRQEYDEQRQTIAAVGNVEIRFQQGVLNADRVEINLNTRLAVASGNVILTRGQQVLRGDRFEYYFVQDRGAILNASGEFYNSTAVQDLALPVANNANAAIIPTQPLSDRLQQNQPLQQITNPGGLGIAIGDQRNILGLPALQQGGTLNRLRFEAERVNFDAQTLQASNVRITNDPFSPPELELRADTAQLTRISPFQDEVTTSRPRLLLDNNFSVPLIRDRLTIDRRQRQPTLLNLGYDNLDRGGLFAESSFSPVNTQKLQLTLTPQYFFQRAVRESKYFNPEAFGVVASLNANLGANTELNGFGALTSLDLNDIENRLRANLRLSQKIGTTLPHFLNLQYTYRDRLFNGSLGFQTVQSSLGALLTSPVIPLGQTGISLNYQASAQLLDADTDFLNLLKPNRSNNRVNLSRYQASASLGRGFVLLQGEALPPTPTEGLRYTPVPVVPYLKLNAGITGVTTGYSSGDFQNSLSGSIGVEGQIGNFSRPYLDYTGFNLTYSQIFPNGKSPYLFDRVVDTKVLSAGINQQVYGPFRAGFQTSINLDNSRQINTDYFVEYSRRTYNLLLRYNPVVQIGSISFRLNDFNWVGNPGPFDGTEVRPVVQGVTR